MRRMYCNATLVLVSTGGLDQHDVSPCRYKCWGNVALPPPHSKSEVKFTRSHHGEQRMGFSKWEKAVRRGTLHSQHTTSRPCGRLVWDVIQHCSESKTMANSYFWTSLDSRLSSKPLPRYHWEHQTIIWRVSKFLNLIFRTLKIRGNLTMTLNECLVSSLVFMVVFSLGGLGVWYCGSCEISDLFFRTLRCSAVWSVTNTLHFVKAT